MRSLLVLCLAAVANAQYDYSLQTGNFDNLRVGDYSAAGSNGVSGRTSYGLGQLDNTGPVGSNEYQKEYFTFSAPENEFNDVNAAEKITSALKRKLRVVFIKGPENSVYENAALQLAKSAANGQTAIYVLNKQADIADLANKLNDLNTNNNNKPEVHFVKYRTPADAENAQRVIQSQYDSLPGSSSSSSSAAPVLNFASKVPVQLESLKSNENTAVPSSNSYITPISSYLPPGRRF